MDAIYILAYYKIKIIQYNSCSRRLAFEKDIMNKQIEEGWLDV